MIKSRWNREVGVFVFLHPRRYDSFENTESYVCIYYLDTSRILFFDIPTSEDIDFAIFQRFSRLWTQTAALPI